MRISTVGPDGRDYSGIWSARHRAGWCAVLIAVALGVLSSCGGGGTGGSSGSTADFTLSATPNALTVQAGQNFVSFSVNVTGLNGFNNLVALSFPSPPAGISVSPSQSVLPGQFAGEGVTAAASVAAGNYTITIQGASGSITHTTTLSVTVTAAAQFSLSVNPTSVTLSPNTSAQVQVSLTATGLGNQDVVLQTTSGLPQLGVNISGGGGITVSQPGTIEIDASLLAQSASNVPVTVTGTAGMQSATVIFTVSITVPFAASSAPSASTMQRTDMQVTENVYDPVRKLVFATVDQLNEVVVFSAIDGHQVAVIPVSRARGIDLSADGKTVIVGTFTRFIVEINPDTLQVVAKVPVPPSSFYTIFIAVPRPGSVHTLASGKVLLVVSDGDTTGSEFLEWDPATGIFNDPTPAGLFGEALLLFVRSADHSRVAVFGQTNATIFDSASDSFGPMQTISALAATLSPDGSRLAVLTGTFTGSQQIMLLDDNFNTLSTYNINAQSVAQGILYSRDGSLLYIFSNVIAALNTQTLALVGLAPLLTQFNPQLPGDLSETGMIFEPVLRGLAFMDASTPRALSLQSISLGSSSTNLTPDAGTLTSPAPTMVNASGGVNGVQVFFGAPPASPNPTPGTNVTVSAEEIAVTPPSAVQPGPVNVTVEDPDGWVGIAPDGYNYGASVLYLATSAGSAAGGTAASLFGYGLGSSPGDVQVTVGGNPATVTSVSIVEAARPYPVQQIDFITPPGAAGPAAVTVTSPVGSATAAQNFQYLASASVYPVAGGAAQVIYDQGRNRLYLSNPSQGQVNVFDLASRTFLPPVAVAAGPQGLALTPDGTKLAVASATASAISVIDPVALQMTQTIPIPPLNTHCEAPLTVAGVATHRMVIDTVCSDGSAGQLTLLDLDTMTFGCDVLPTCGGGTGGFGGSFLNVASSTDGSELFISQGGVSGPLAVGLWNVTADTFFSQDLNPFSDIAVAGDGNLFATNFAIAASDLDEQFVPQEIDYLNAAANNFNNLPGEKLHASGSLLYIPTTTGVDIFDSHRARLVLRVALPEAIVASLNGLAIDQTGSQLFLISASGLTVAQLSQVPLSIGSVTPSQGPASGGTAVIIRGSGFQAGTMVQFGETTVPATLIDSDTLQLTTPALALGPLRVTVNSGGSKYNLDLGFTAN